MILSFEKFNESNFNDIQKRTLNDNIAFSKFLKEVRNEFEDEGFIFKSQNTAGSGAYLVNNVPMYFQSSGTNSFRLVFHTLKPDFPKDVAIELENHLRHDLEFYSVEGVVEFFNKYLPQYTKKLSNIHDIGALDQD